ncbi:MAG: ATP-dependent DNA helicase, partial [Lachnospiraceae bacterium]|nr:ATP-dependent DNA helicase [Lachnospiraceae bacterium]
MEVHISVRSLVEFILRSGDIDNRRTASPENAMQEGSRIHRMIQRRMGPEYQAEVGLKYVYDTGEYEIIVEGRADGIITEQLLQEQLTQRVRVTVDEIKGVFRDIKKMKDSVPVHLAQAKCYAYIYAAQNGLNAICVRMTYCHMETEEIRYFHYDYTHQELQEWFEEVMEQYRKWADYSFAWQKMRQESIKALKFPYSYREGQKELASYVYRTIYHKRKLFIEAPTGVGKTISTVFPAVKAMGEELCEKIFYLTAKTIT